MSERVLRQAQHRVLSTAELATTVAVAVAVAVVVGALPVISVSTTDNGACRLDVACRGQVVVPLTRTAMAEESEDAVDRAVGVAVVAVLKLRRLHPLLPQCQPLQRQPLLVLLMTLQLVIADPRSAVVTKRGRWLLMPDQATLPSTTSTMSLRFVRHCSGDWRW